MARKSALLVRGSAVAERPAEAGFLAVEGRQLPFTVRWSSRRKRSYGFVVDPEGTVKFSAPRWVRVAELIDFAQRRKRFILKRLEELEGRKKRAAEKELMADKWCELPDIWYKKAARKTLPARVRFWAREIGVSVGTVRITGGRTVWGSCNSYGNISLSWRLMLVAQDLREYIVVHEVCHRRYMSHGVRFWALVGKYVPDYVEKRRKLNRLGETEI